MKKRLWVMALLVLTPILALASGNGGIEIAGIPLEFVFFALTLVGVALFHHHTLYVALGGLATVVIYKLSFTSFDVVHHAAEEWEVLLNLFLLLLGFSILAKHFEDSGLPEIMPNYLPDDWKGGFMLLVIIFVMSSFLDNIAAAMIGATIASTVFRGKVHIGYMVAIVAASNAGGAGSVVGDTTTTMIWIAGCSPLIVLKAFIGSAVALVVIGIPASIVQDKYNRIQKDASVGAKVDWGRLSIVALILIGAVITNIWLDFPAVGVVAAIALGAFFKRTDWQEARKALPGSIFLLSLVFTASMMPVDRLPAASWQTAFSLGFISSVFDNIPLTKLAITQGGFDWGLLAYAVGFGGSMIWFGSSAGVALSNIFPEAKSVFQWVKKGWFVIVAYVIGFFALYLIAGWHPTDLKKGDTTKTETPAEVRQE